MKRILLSLAVCVLPAATGWAGLVSESWGGKGRYSHPNALKVVSGKVPRLVFDLSALPKGAKVHHASLFVSAPQPREPIRIFAVEKLQADGTPAGGEPLKLEGPRYRSFDATAAVQRWSARPADNLGLALAAFAGAANKSHLEVCYEGKSGKVPPQVEGLEVLHRAGQTFLLWKELPVYRPPAKKTVWIERVAGYRSEVANGPGKGVKGFARPASIRLKTLRDLQGLALRDKPIGHWARAMPPFKRLREVPTVRYRVYRHDRKITAGNLHQARRIGQVDALSAYQAGFIHIKSHGEYYGPHEDGESLLPTWSIGPGKPVLPGQAYYVHTPKAAGKAYYAVTAVQDGTENAVAVSDANRSAAVAETPAEAEPVLQFVTENRTRYRQSNAVEYWYAYWLAPPCANVADNRPRRIVMAMAPEFKPPGPLNLGTRSGMGPGWKVDKIDTAYLRIEQDVAYGGDLCYHQGRGTLRSFREHKVEYFSDRYVTRIVRWALGKWPIDRSRITSLVGTHYGIRHPELFPILWLAPYSVDYDQKWNPTCGSLTGRLGPAELSKTVDGHPAWDAFNVAWYLRRNPGKDIPFWVHDVGGKEGGHAVEFGWQDDGKGLAALRDARQPFVAHWGGGRFGRQLRKGLATMRWTKSVPAFSNCSLDANPGNGDPADGDPWGQINGFLFWETETVVDEKGRWEMTVFLTPDCFEDACTVDLTPRHLKAFKPTPGEAFKWSNTSVATGKEVASGTVKADKWARVTIPKIAVTKGKNRIKIQR